MNRPYRPNDAVRDMERTVDESSLPSPSSIELARRAAALTGLAGLALASAGWVFYPYAFWRAYGFAWLLWTSVTLGCSLWAALGRVIHPDPGSRAVMSAGSRTAPLVAVLVVPLALHGSQSATWMISAAATRPITAAVRLVLVGPTLAALALSVVALAGLSRCERDVLTVAAERALRLRLSVLLSADAASAVGQALISSAAPALGRLDRATVATLALAVLELGVAVGLALPSGTRRLVALGAAAFLAHAALLQRLMPRAATLAGDTTWTSHALLPLLAGAVGGLWLALFLWRLDRRPPPPLLPCVDEYALRPAGAAANTVRP